MQLGNVGTVIPGFGNQLIHLPIVEYDMYIYLPLSLFVHPTQPDILKSISGTVIETPPATICKIIDPVHKNVCGHTNYSGIKTLLQRNNIWSDAVDHQLPETVEKCTHWRATAKPHPSRKVSLSSLNCQFNDIICVYSFFLDCQPLLHIMYGTTRYSATLTVKDTSLEKATWDYETAWLGQFWPPNTAIGDESFSHTEFISYVNNFGSYFKPLLPQHHSTNALESKHNITRSI